ncbi:MAG: hypothetical protein AVDCRST_MAG91-1121, partial [uncultured Sphingomonadaceae bacterium]
AERPPVEASGETRTRQRRASRYAVRRAGDQRVAGGAERQDGGPELQA